MYRSLLSLIVIFFPVYKSYAYDIRCIYPRELGEDLLEIRYTTIGAIFQGIMVEFAGEAYNHLMTSPKMIRSGVYQNSCAVLCLAFHDPDVLNPWTKEQTFTTVPEFGHNAYSVAMCQYQCWLYGSPEIETETKEAFNERGLNVTEAHNRPDIMSAMTTLQEDGSTNEIMAILEDEDYHPYTVGHIAGIQMRWQQSDDGFNANGNSTWCPILQQEVPCSANCRPFQDTVGYNPVPDPRIHTYLSTDSSKYDCTGYCRYWQPEQNRGSDRGTISREEFTLPHIGIKANTYLLDAEVTLEDPQYDYYQESLQVVEELRLTSSDPFKKKLVEYFIGRDHVGMHDVRADVQRKARDLIIDYHSYQDDSLFYFGLGLIEYESVIHVWREKLHHNLVRPTTVIKQWGNDTLNTYGGDINSSGPLNITARDFEALLFTVDSTPEFPSEHSCYCTALMEFVDLYLDSMYGVSLQNFELRDILYANMTVLRDRCANSRVWGGYHFPDSVAAGIQKCEGIGALGMDYINQVKNNSTFNGGWYVNDTLPECPELD